MMCLENDNKPSLEKSILSINVNTTVVFFLKSRLPAFEFGDPIFNVLALSVCYPVIIHVGVLLKKLRILNQTPKYARKLHVRLAVARKHECGAQIPPICCFKRELLIID